jgi:hypothetical protein
VQLALVGPLMIVALVLFGPEVFVALHNPPFLIEILKLASFVTALYNMLMVYTRTVVHWATIKMVPIAQVFHTLILNLVFFVEMVALRDCIPALLA